jgi:hypothetical protein
MTSSHITPKFDLRTAGPVRLFLAAMVYWLDLCGGGAKVRYAKKMNTG